MPQRIQRKRTKGWKMPENTVSVTRPGKWGNPYKVVEEDGMWWIKDTDGNYWDAPHAESYSATKRCIDLFIAWIEAKVGSGKINMEDLKGKNLACFCPLDQPCHADVLLKLANS